jgi:hypothetical protein
MELSKKLLDEIWDYCRLNKITDVDGFIEKMVQQGYTVEKYGATPSERVVEKEVEKIVQVEKIVEKPVEIIKEVEKIVEKEVYITDDEATKELTEKIEGLNQQIRQLEKDKETLVEAEKIQVKIVFKVSKERNALREDVERLTQELEAEKAKPKVEEKKDIYGDEGKQGFFGSNISNLWNKDNKNKQQ